jgi:hypothetical protein
VKAGLYDGKDGVIKRMKALRETGMRFYKIGAALNSEGVPTRKAGKKWFGLTGNKILAAQESDGMERSDF